MAIIKSKLSLIERECVDHFIATFLPRRGSKLKHSGNELSFIHMTLSRIFGKWFSFHPTKQDLLYAFDRLGYEIFSRNGDWDANTKQYKPVAGNKSDRFDDAMYIYIDVEASLMRQLKLTTTGLPATTSIEKKRQTKDMIEKIISFQKKYKV